MPRSRYWRRPARRNCLPRWKSSPAGRSPCWCCSTAEGRCAVRKRSRACCAMRKMTAYSTWCSRSAALMDGASPQEPGRTNRWVSAGSHFRTSWRARCSRNRCIAHLQSLLGTRITQVIEMVDLENATVVDEALIQEVTRRIVEKFHPEKVILFGSHAHGDARPDSDLDLIVVMKSDKPYLDRTVQVAQLFIPRGWPMDMVVYTPDEWERDLEVIGRLPSMIKDEYRVLHG